MNGCWMAEFRNYIFLEKKCFDQVALSEPKGGLDRGSHLRPPALLLPPQEEGEGLRTEEEQLHHLPPPIPQWTH